MLPCTPSARWISRVRGTHPFFIKVHFKHSARKVYYWCIPCTLREKAIDKIKTEICVETIVILGTRVNRKGNIIVIEVRKMGNSGNMNNIQSASYHVPRNFRISGEFRGHNPSYVNLRSFDGRPPFCGCNTRPTTASRCSTNAALPSGLPVRV